jgi:hypothetical protein
MNELKHLLLDYLHATKKQGHAFLNFKIPDHYLGVIKKGKASVVLIPGIFEKWHFLQTVADEVSLKGHPVHVIESIGYNDKAIHKTAREVLNYIKANHITGAVIIAHSKGGLVGKYLMSMPEGRRRVKKIIAIASPFAGSKIVHLVKHRLLNELAPDSAVIRNLKKNKQLNRKIVSIFGEFDNHVWPTESCRLLGAKNYQVSAHGHHKILEDKKVCSIILKELKK